MRKILLVILITRKRIQKCLNKIDDYQKMAFFPQQKITITRTYSHIPKWYNIVPFFIFSTQGVKGSRQKSTCQEMVYSVMDSLQGICSAFTSEPFV